MFSVAEPDEQPAVDLRGTPASHASRPMSGGLAVAEIALLATSPGGTVTDVPSPTRPPGKFMPSPAARTLSTPAAVVGIEAMPPLPGVAAAKMLDPLSAYNSGRAGPPLAVTTEGFDVATRQVTTTVAVDATGSPTPVRRARSLSSPSPVIFARSNPSEPIASWKLQPERPITSLCAGPKPGLVFAGSKETVVLLDGDDGNVIKEFRVGKKYQVKDAQATGGVSPYLGPQSASSSPVAETAPTLPSPGERHRHSLELTDKDFIATMYWIEDTEGIHSGRADRARRASFASDMSSPGGPGPRGRPPGDPMDVEPMLLDGGTALSARNSLDRISMDMERDPGMFAAPEKKPASGNSFRSGLTAILNRRRSSPHAIEEPQAPNSPSADTSNAPSPSTPNQGGQAPTSPALSAASRSSSPASTSNPVLPNGWLIAHFALYRPVQWDISRPSRPRRIYPVCGCIFVAPRTHIMWGACDDHIFRQWDLRTGACIREIDSKTAGQIPKSITVSSKYLFTTLGNSIERWNLETGHREVNVHIKAPEPFDDDPLRRQRRASIVAHKRVPQVFTEFISLPPIHPGDSIHSESDLYGKSARHGVFAWDFRSDPRGAFMRWPLMLDSGKETVHWMMLPDSNAKGARRRLWVAGERMEHKGMEKYIEEHDPVKREKLRSWRLHVMPMSMCVVQGEGARMYVGTAEGMVTVWNVSEPEPATKVIRAAPTAGAAEHIATRRIVREVRDIYG